MQITSEIKTKCYILLDGLERSLAENLIRNCLVDSPDFLTIDERGKTLDRLREDINEPNWKLDDSNVEDLLQYLDLGDFVGILNRNALTMKNVVSANVKEATSLITQSEALSIRKRVMHPVRPLEVDDFPKLLQLATSLPRVAPSMHWDPLSINVRRLSNSTDILEVSIPSYWAEDSLVVDNLPAAEFDDTGFIGRSKDRRELRKWLESEHRVITVVGESGVGKTALSLRVCNDIIEDSKLFDRVVWVSLKTKYLAPEGVLQIRNAIDSFGSLTDHLAESFQVISADVWQSILNHMKSVRTLLVIDNMETIGNELRDFLVDIPANSKVLLTSRVGLGEIEARYELTGFSPKDAVVLLNTLISVYSCKPLKNVSQQTLAGYANKLGYNPLLLKWFVLATCKGTDPSELLSKGLQDSLEFFYSSVYDRLGQLSKNILSVILAARKGLTKPQLQELTNSSHVQFTQAIQELVRSSMEPVSEVNCVIVR
jgi:LuxR family transcriptional regulator, glucitol operon activator